MQQQSPGITGIDGAIKYGIFSTGSFYFAAQYETFFFIFIMNITYYNTQTAWFT
jgi:hypothetical protein